MKQALSICMFGIAVLAGACASSDTVAPGLPGTDVPIVRFRAEPYSFAYNSGLDHTARLVIRDEITWQATWNQIWRGNSEVPSVPAVDFSREMVVVAALGTRSSGGYGIMIDNATETPSNALNIVVRSITPGAKCATTAAFTQPVDIARIPLRLSVGFTERSEVSEC
jgi:hypothetical protein